MRKSRGGRQGTLHMRVEDENGEKQIPTLLVVLLTMLITGGVLLGSDVINNLTNYGSQEKPQPLELSQADTIDGEFYSPVRAKRRANFFLRRQSEETDLNSQEKQELENEDRARFGQKETAQSPEEPKATTKGLDMGEPDLSGEYNKDIPESSVGDWGGAVGSADGIKLSGVMLNGSIGIAVFDYKGNSHTKHVGERIGRYKVDKILADKVILDDGSGLVTLALNGNSSASAPGTAAVGGHPVLPDPGSVPPPAPPRERAAISFQDGGAYNDFESGLEVAPVPDEVAIERTPRREAPVPSRVDIYDLTDDNSVGSNKQLGEVAKKTAQAKNGRSKYSEEELQSKYSSQGTAQVNMQAPPASPTPLGHPTKEELAKYLERGAMIVSEVKVQPVDKEMGVKVKFLKEDNILNRLGLQDGDIVTRVNNRSIVNSEEFLNSILTIGDMPFVNIEYKRKGREEVLVYDL